MLRIATAADALSLVKLVNRAYRGETGKKGWTTESDLLAGQRTDLEGIKSILDAENFGRDQIILVEDANTENLAACVHLEKRSEEMTYLGMLTVDPDRQSHGVGHETLRGAETFARDHFGANVIEMTVIGQRSELINWYRKKGYELTTERRPFPVDDPRCGIPLRPDLFFIVLKKTLDRL